MAAKFKKVLSFDILGLIENCGENAITFLTGKRLEKIMALSEFYNIPVIEDSAESLGSLHKGRHTGTFGSMGILSFNGNKIITGGGGGCIITNDKDLALKAKHLSTTAKIDHKWNLTHDIVGYNYRMPNLNAALGLAQIEKIEFILKPILKA